MRIRVYKGEEGDLTCVVEPSPGKGRPPVLLKGITAVNVIEEILPIIEQLRQPKEPRLRPTRA